MISLIFIHMFELKYVQDEFSEKIKGRVVFPGVEFRNVFVVHIKRAIWGIQSGRKTRGVFHV